MIQDIEPHVFNNHYEPKEPRGDDIVFAYDKKNVLLKTDHTFYHVDELPDTSLQYLFSIDDQRFFLVQQIEQPTTAVPVISMRSYEPKYLGFACAVGKQIESWMKENKYCGTCGHELVPSRLERAMFCPGCGRIIYPKIMPAVIVAVINDKNQLLVSKYANRSYTHYALIAGFNEVGETIEETVHREVLEETGVRVKDLHYYKSQPWAFTSTLLFGFVCHVDGDDTITVDHNELKLARWADKDEEIDSMDSASLTSEMIHCFQSGIFQ